MDENKTVLERIKEATLAEGFKDGTPAYQKRFRQLHVIECREMRGLMSCQECPYNDACDLYIQVKRDFLGV